MRHHLKSHWFSIIFFAAYAAFELAWFLAGLEKSLHYFPDELARMQVVDFIFNNGTLPTGLEPEVRISHWGSSYGVQPNQLAAILAAILKRCAAFFSTDATVLLGAARLVSTVSVFVAVLFIHKTARRIFIREDPQSNPMVTSAANSAPNSTKSTKPSKSNMAFVWLMTVTFAFLPQVLHLSSYFNNDAMSLAGSSIVFYGLVCAWRNNDKGDFPWTQSSVLAIVIGSITILLSYYNAYGWTLVAAIMVVWLWINHRHDPSYNKRMVRLCTAAIIIITASAGIFFIRNAILHNGDFLGMTTAANLVEQYADQSVRALKGNVPLARGSSLLGMLRDGSWFLSTAKSFVAGFSYMSVFLPSLLYLLYYCSAFIGFVGCVVLLLKKVSRKTRQRDKRVQKQDLRHGFICFCVCLLASVAIPLALSIYYSYTTDYQPQGRYIISCLPTLVLLLVKGYETLLSQLKKPKITTLLAALISVGYIGICIGIYRFVYLVS